MYPIFDFLPLVEMLRKNILPLIPLFVLQFHIITIFSKLFLHNLRSE